MNNFFEFKKSYKYLLNTTFFITIIYFAFENKEFLEVYTNYKNLKLENLYIITLIIIFRIFTHSYQTVYLYKIGNMDLSVLESANLYLRTILGNFLSVLQPGSAYKISYLKIKYNEENEDFRHIERNYYQADYDDIVSTPDYKGQDRFNFSFCNEYGIITDIINNLLVTLNEIPNPSEIGGTLLDIYLTKEIYHKYSNLFDIGVSSAEKLKYNVGNGATIPFSWLKKHPDILYSKFTNHNSKYQDEPEFKIIHEIFHTKIEEPTTKRTVATLTPEESLKFNQDLLNWILKECPILISTLAGDKIEITGCDLSTVEDIIRKIKEIELGKDFVKYEKIHRTKKVRCFRKLKKILGVKNPLVKEKAIVMFYLTHGSEMLDVDVLKAYILLMIRGQENPIRPSLTLIFNNTDFQTTSREPASQFFTEGGAADGPRDITI